MRLLELIRRPFRARRLRRNRPPKALSLQDEAEAAWAEAEELQRRLSAEQEENRRQVIFTAAGSGASFGRCRAGGFAQGAGRAGIG